MVSTLFTSANTIFRHAATGFTAVLQATRNRLTHALNGNRNKSKTRVVNVTLKPSLKKRSTKKPSAKKRKKAAKPKRTSGRTITGHGDYELGKNIGGKIGTWLGGKVHSWISSIFGSGDYEIASPTEHIQGNSLLASDTMPQFDGSKDGRVRFRFSEFLGYRKVTTAFSVNTFDLDVASRGTFPWSYPMSGLS